MGTADGIAALDIYLGAHCIAHPERTLGQLAVVHILAALVLLHIGDTEQAAVLAAADDLAVVGDLAAHLGIERSAVEDDYGFHAGDYLVDLLIFGDYGEDLCADDGVVVVALELSLRHVLAELDAGPAEVAQRLARFSRAHALLVHELVESILIDGHILFGDHLEREVYGEAIGVVELESVGAGEHLFAAALVALEHLGEDPNAAVDSLGEILLLNADNSRDIILLLKQVGISSAALMDDGAADLIEERLVHAEELAVPRGAAQQAAQDIATSLIGW